MTTRDTNLDLTPFIEMDDLHPRDPESLLAKAKAGDGAALAQLLEQYRGYILSVASKAAGLSDHSCQDAFQGTFVRLSNRISAFDGNLTQFRVYLAKIVRTTALDIRRLKKDVAAFPEVEDDPRQPLADGSSANPPKRAEVNERKKRVAEAVQKLPSRYEKVYLRRCESRSYAEIAKEMGCTEEAARHLFSRAWQMLKKELETE